MDSAPSNTINEILSVTEKNNVGEIVSGLLSMDLSSLKNVTADAQRISQCDESSNDEDDMDVEYEVVFDEEISSNNIKKGMTFSFDFSPESSLTCDAHDLSEGCHANDSQQVQLFPPKTQITRAVIEQLEDELEFYEKVSLVFLLYDSDDLALQRLKIALRSIQTGSIIQCGLLSDWAGRENSDNWADKFLEALCIIQNISIIKKLGYNEHEIYSRFLYSNPHSSLFVDLMRKALYHVCENLTLVQLNRLSQLVEQDMEEEGRVPAHYDVMYMEMNLLHWMSQRHLKVGIQGVYDDANVRNITKHLKVMGELNLVEYLESIAKSCTRQETDAESVMNDQMSSYSHGPISSHSVTSQCVDTRSTHTPVNCYDIDPNNVGYCVIINQKNFYVEKDPNYRDLVSEDSLETRIGTDVDRDRLCEAFLNFGFAVKIWENLTHIQMMDAIRESSTQLVRKEHSCFALCILSHGKKNAVYGVNSVAVYVDDIERLIHGKFCPRLMYKPKIIIIQACQGMDKQDALPVDIATDGPTYSKTCPEVSDTITFWSTVPGYAAFRDRITGSWFIKSLWKHLLHKDAIGADALSIFVDVIGDVYQKRAPISGELKAMTPQFTSTMGKKLFFPYHREAHKSVAKRILERYLFDDLIDQYFKRMLTSKQKYGFSLRRKM